MNYVLLIIGFILLVKGADVFVESSSSIAKILRIPSLIIGLTIVAFGTSAPEAAVSITAALNNQNGMAIGNIVGSNIFNLLMVVGISGFIKTLYVDKAIISKEFPFLILASILLFVLACDIPLQDTSSNILSRGDGIVLLMFFIIFMYSLLKVALQSMNQDSMSQLSISSEHCIDSSDGTLIRTENESLLKNIVISIIGIILIILGGKMVVSSASQIASSFGVSDQLIGLTIVSIGTSLPEFVTSIIAAIKGESSIALGNVIGSNMFNILFVLGASAFISPMYIDPTLFIDTLFMIFVTILTYLFAVKKRDINKGESFILILLYIMYMIYLLLNA
ncbi:MULTISPECIES: calcium/sodium antiporter [unclassified Romboutsia]|uniref:calcium/sodium antiporter n=1 Tax=unclassified Romboutsia TaxID=2626894 RepID=UPI0008227C05|nr:MULTISPECIES: calcium/sodium antiporter [unclassified Romboutsia]SCH61717.1 Inner membrane protein yrbG [uncultured Clostridium sp.]